MVVKILFSLQNVMEKLFEMHYSLEKNCMQVPKMVTPQLKNNDPSLRVPTADLLSSAEPFMCLNLKRNDNYLNS